MKEQVLVVTCAVFTEQAGSGLCFAAEAAGGVRSGKQQVWSRAGCGGALLGGACRLCRRAVRKFGIPEMQHSHGWKPSRGGDTPTKEAKGCRAHSRISGMM